MTPVGSRATRTPSEKRTRAVVVGASSMLIARGFTFTTMFATIAIVSRAVPAEAFGLWTVLSAFAFFGTSFDLGLGQAMRNRLTHLSAMAVRDQEAEQRLFFSVFLALICASAALIIGLILTASAIPWVTLLQAERSSLADQIPRIATAVATLFLASMALNLAGIGLLAYQESGVRGIFDFGQSFLLLLTAAILANWVEFVDFVIAYYIVFDLALLATLIVFLRRRRWRLRWIRPRTVLIEIRGILSSSIVFWLMGSAALIVFSTDPIIAARVLGLSETGAFSVSQRLFMVLLAAHFAVLTPLWAGYSHALATDDWLWIRKAFRQSLYFTFGLIILGGTSLVIAAPWVLRILVGKEVYDHNLIMSLTAWAGLYALTTCYSVLLTGVGKIRRQAAVAVAGALLNWPVSLWLGHRYGSSGIIGGTIVVILPLLISNMIQVHTLIARESGGSGRGSTGSTGS